MTVGSRSTNIALGTCFPEPVSLKKVLNASSATPGVVSLKKVTEISSVYDTVMAY